LVGVSKRSTRVDTEPRFLVKLKAIRDKRERFYSGGWLGGMERDPDGVAPQRVSRWWNEVAQRILASASCLRPEGPEDDEGVCGVGREPCSASPALRASGALGW
jgi:hypothetical protein